MPSSTRRRNRRLEFARLYGAGPNTIRRMIQDSDSVEATPPAEDRAAIFPRDLRNPFARSGEASAVEQPPIPARTGSGTRPWASASRPSAARRVMDLADMLPVDPTPTPAQPYPGIYVPSRPEGRLGTQARILMRGMKAFAFRPNQESRARRRSDGVRVEVLSMGPRTQYDRRLVKCRLLRDWTDPAHTDLWTNERRPAVDRARGDVVEFELQDVIPYRACAVMPLTPTDGAEAVLCALPFTWVFDDERFSNRGTVARRRSGDDEEDQ